MTARAFLRLSDELHEAFASAQDDDTLRYLRVEVVDGDTLATVGSRQKGDLSADFDSLSEVCITHGSVANGMPAECVEQPKDVAPQCHAYVYVHSRSCVAAVG